MILGAELSEQGLKKVLAHSPDADRLARRRGIGAAAGSAALLLGALGFQYLGGLAPCHLCLLQRWPHAVAVLLGLSLLVVPARLTLALGALTLLVGAGIGAYHVGVEQKWWQGPMTCTAPDPGSIPAGDLLNQILDGQVTDLEVGAFALAMRIKGETPAEMAGFLDATHARMHRVPAASQIGRAHV